MIYTIDGKFVTIDNKLFERKVKTLTYQVDGSWFPMSYQDTTNSGSQRADELLIFHSKTPNTITINYGDGNVVTKQFEYVSANIYKVAYSTVPAEATANWRIPRHTYTDGNSGARTITFEFEDAQSISYLSATWTRFLIALPRETIFFEGLTYLRYLRGGYVTSVPDAFPPNLDSYTISGTVTGLLLQIPDTVFSSKISVLNISAAYNLSDTISSNFFKINQLKATLREFSAEGTEMIRLTESIRECTNLTNLQVGNNKFTSIPAQVDSLPLLVRLYVGNVLGSSLTDTTIPTWYNLQNLSSLAFSFPDANLSDIPNAWKYLYSLNNFVTFNSFISSDAKFDEFIPYFYTLCTENGSIVAGGSAAPYPNRFRSISWGHSALSFTGAKVAPTGYVQGVSNGTLTTNGQRVYVLQNQYNHTIAHGTPL